MNTIPFELSCQKYKERFSVQLQKAGNDVARFQLYTAGLQEFSRKILPELRALGEKDGTGSTRYQQAQQVAANLLMWLGFPYVRSCRDFNAGVMLFAGLIAACDDPVLKRRLVAYSNQLKTKWNKDEPGGLSHNPRAAKCHNFQDRSESQLYVGIGLFFLFLLGVIVVAKGNRLHRREIAVVQMIESPADGSIQASVASTPAQPRAPKIEQSVAPILPGEVSGIYQFTDARGGMHFADQIDKVPVDYRSSVKFTPEGDGESSAFRVQIDGSHVLVPVTLRHGGKSVTALLLLDTGCTITTISEELATRLNIDSDATQYGTSRVADGRMVSTRRTRVDQLMVGKRSQSSAEVSIMPHIGDEVRYDGLLGMSFLRQHRYQVDYDNGLIRWQ